MVTCAHCYCRDTDEGTKHFFVCCKCGDRVPCGPPQFALSISLDKKNPVPLGSAFQRIA